MKFLIAIEPGTERTAYGGVVPDLPGCFSAGDTLDEAFAMAAEAIDGHVEILLEEGAKLPAPTRCGVTHVAGSGPSSLQRATMEDLTPCSPLRCL